MKINDLCSQKTDNNQEKTGKAHWLCPFPFIGILNWEVRLFPFSITCSNLNRRLANIDDLEIV